MTIIAEIGTSHEGSLEKAFKLIDTAAEAGADFIKFQWVYADEILHPKTGFVKLPTGNIPLYQRFKNLEVDRSFYEKCIDYTHKKGLKFTCSPFGLRSLKELLSCDIDAVKIASPEVNHFPMLQELSKVYGKIPVILSSGVSKLSDLEKAIDILTQNKHISCSGEIPPLTLLHCITSYPAPENEYNVKAVKTLHEIFGIPTGISDHSLDPVLVPVLTTMMGGSMIEKHITLSRKTEGLDDPVALEGEDFALMTHCVHQTQALLHKWAKEESAMFQNSELNGEKADKLRILSESAEKEIIKQLEEKYPLSKIQAVLGTGVKRLADSEKQNYGRTNRSLHYMKSFPKGHKIQEEDISILRTEKVLTPGISPLYYEMLKGAVLTRDVEDGEGVQLEDFISR